MPEFLSDEWFEAARDAAARATVDPSVSLVVEQVVECADGERRYQLRLGEGRVRVTTDVSVPADVRLTATREVAAAIAAGERSAQGAFMAGELRIGGDMARLLDAREALVGLGDVLAPTRAGDGHDPPTDPT